MKPMPITETTLIQCAISSTRSLALRCAWLFLLAAGIGNAVHAADYYVVASNPSLNQENSLATTLMVLDRQKKDLGFTRTITTLRQGAEMVRSYADLGLVLIAGRGGPGRVQFDLIHYDDVMRNHQLEIPLVTESAQFKDNRFPLDIHMLRDAKGVCRIGVRQSVFDQNHHWLKGWVSGIDMAGKMSVVPPAQFFDIHNSGVPNGVGYEVTHDFYSAFGEVDGKFSMGFAGGAVDATFAGPDLDKYEMKIGLVQTISNLSIRVISGPQTMGTKGSGTYFIQNKMTGKWSDLIIEGDFNAITAFEDRLAFAVGFQSVSYEGRDYNTAVARVPDVESPYFENTKVRLASSRATGKIVLVDLGRDLTTEFSVASRDFDVLWLAEDRVLYRVESSIYERTWSAQGLGKEKLLVKNDEIVPAIHWAFPASGDRDKTRERCR